MFLDLDRFKLVNDSLGHGAGDELLACVADRLRSVVRATDTLSRFGGDEFVILCEGMASQEAVMALAERAMTAIDEPFVINGERFHIGVSIGVAFVDDDGPSPEELLGDADYAMYLAKARSGQGRVQLFDQATRAVARQRVHTETALARALEREELVVFYQPIVETATRRWVGVEALLRWQHPTRGLLAAGRVPRRGRADRTHRPHRRLGAVRGLRPGPALEPPTARRRAPGRQREPVGTPADRARPGRHHRRLAARRPTSIPTPCGSSSRSPRPCSRPTRTRPAGA